MDLVEEAESESKQAITQSELHNVNETKDSQWQLESILAKHNDCRKSQWSKNEAKPRFREASDQARGSPLQPETDVGVQCKGKNGCKEQPIATDLVNKHHSSPNKWSRIHGHAGAKSERHWQHDRRWSTETESLRDRESTAAQQQR